MKKPLTLYSFKDCSSGDHVYQLPSTYEIMADFCDCCDEQIEEDKNIGTDYEDFCINCFEAGGVSRCLKEVYEPEEYFHIINDIKDKLHQ